MKDGTKKEIYILLERYPVLKGMKDRLIASVELLCDCFRSGGKLLVCGNGGSAADGMHIVGELMKGFVLERKLPEEVQDELRARYPDDAAYYIANLQQAIPAISLSGEVSLSTAYSNDRTADLVFAQQVLGYGNPGDVLLAISTSGNSANVVHAAKIAKCIGLFVISLTGSNGGFLREISDILLPVPSDITYQIQELHLPIYHALCLAIEKELFPNQGEERG